MRVGRIRRTAAVVGLAMLAAVPAALAAPGDRLATVSEPEPMVSCCGIGLDYDGTNILYTHYRDRKVHLTDLTGADLGEVALINPDGSPFTGDAPNAIAYNFSDGFLYAGGWASTNLYKIDLASGVTQLFKANALGGYGSFGFIDGLAWDPTDNTFWMSDDVNCAVRHLDATGSDIGGFDGCALGLSPNSGLAVSLNGTLWYGTNGVGDIYSLDTSTSPPTVLGMFAHVDGRDEDMVCGPEYTKADGTKVETLLSQDAYGNWFAVFEVAEGECTTPAPPTEVEKEYTHTNVCFERDNDRDGQFNEDPVNFNAAGEAIDDDGDGLWNEDPVDCPDGTRLGDELAQNDGGTYLVKAVINAKGRVKSYNPGQYYAVSTVTALRDLPSLVISEHYGECTEGDYPVSALSPTTGGGAAVLVRVDADGTAWQVADAKSDQIEITDSIPAGGNGTPDNAEAYVENVPEGAVYKLYVKFAPGLKRMDWEGPASCDNSNIAEVFDEIGDPVGAPVAAEASLKVKKK